MAEWPAAGSTASENAEIHGSGDRLPPVAETPFPFVEQQRGICPLLLHPQQDSEGGLTRPEFVQADPLLVVACR